MAFPHRHEADLAHVRPLVDRLQDLLVAPPRAPQVAVFADPQARPRRGAWNVQVFDGLGVGLQGVARRRLSLASLLRRGSDLPAIARRSRFQQVNAYGPRWADLLGTMLRDVEISRHGHLGLNDVESIRHDPEGPLVWAPLDGHALGGGSSLVALHAFVGDVARLASRAPILVWVPPRMRRASERGLRRLARTAGVTVATSKDAPHTLLEGARGLLAAPGSLALEAYCSGIPVALAPAPGGKAMLRGRAAELAERVPTFTPGSADLGPWAEAPDPASDEAWAQDLLYAPRRSRNDAFAAQLRKRAVEMSL